MELHLEFHPHRFITRYNAIQQELGSREVIYIDEDEDEEDENQAEEVEVEGEEEVMVGDDEEKHEYEVEVEEVAEEVSTGERGNHSMLRTLLNGIDPTHTATGQLPVPLPTTESITNDGTSASRTATCHDADDQDTEPAQDGSEHLVESTDEVEAVATEDLKTCTSAAYTGYEQS
jgi:hypothetical protein